jgi:hypothetical protein
VREEQDEGGDRHHGSTAAIARSVEWECRRWAHGVSASGGWVSPIVDPACAAK